MNQEYEIVKPSFLYHASQKRNIKIFEPRAESIRDKSEGPVVFATPVKAYATMFLVPSDDSWTKKGRFGDTYYTVISDKKRYQDSDKGGSVYALPSDTFETKAGIGMGTGEWTSKVPVKPASKEDFESGLDAMLENGVQVYFVDTETFKKIERAEDHGFSILKGLESENKKQNKNIKEFVGRFS